MPPTMEDVAQRAGVSKATVSLVLNKKRGVSPETQRTVLRAVEELAYRLPERRPLRSPASRTFTILYHVESEFRAEPYDIIPGFLRGVRAFAREAKVHLTVLAGYRGEATKQIGSYFLTSDGLLPDGLLLMGPSLHRRSESITQALKKDIPTVVLCRNWPDMPFSTVGHNHYEQARIALDHLIQLGHRTIAFVAGEADEEYDWCQRRLDCYRKVMTDLTQEVDEGLVVLARDGSEAVQTLTTRRPEVTAIFANSDSKAIEVMQGLHDAGLCVPEDVSVIGQDDARQSPKGLPELTTVGFSHVEVGYLAAELLLKQIRNAEIVRGNIWVRSYLVKRNSCSKARSV